MKTPIFLYLILSVLLGVSPGLASLVHARMICPSRFQTLFDSFEARDPLRLPITVGIELEGSLMNHPSLFSLAHHILNTVSKRYPDAQITTDRVKDVHRIRYTRKDGTVKQWFVLTDHSIEASGLTPEITSPILDSVEDLKSFHEVMRVVNRTGIKAEPSTAGVHIHVGFGDASAGEVAALMAVFKEIEEDLLRLFHSTKERYPFIQPTSDELVDLLLNQALDGEYALRKMINSQDRQRALNLRSLLKYGTVEFRLFNSTFDLHAIGLMRDFSARLVQAIRTKNPELVRYLTEEKGEIELAKIASILNAKIARSNTRKILDRIAAEARRSRGPAFQGHSNSAFATNLATLLATLHVAHALGEGDGRD